MVISVRFERRIARYLMDTLGLFLFLQLTVRTAIHELGEVLDVVLFTDHVVGFVCHRVLRYDSQSYNTIGYDVIVTII